MSEADWHTWQDRQAEEIAIERAQDVMSRPDPVLQTWYWAGFELFFNAHIHNLIALHAAGERLRILDVGCGKGDLAGRLARLFPFADVVGLDANHASLEVARSAWPNVRFVEGRFEEAPSLGTFDVVICSEIYEHVENPEVLLSTIYAVLRPGGHMSFSTPSGWMWRRPGPLNAYRFAADPRGYRLLLRPERNWQKALINHAASRPSVVKSRLSDAGFEIVARTSSIWFLEDGRYGLPIAHCAASPGAGPSRAEAVLLRLDGP